MPHRNTIPLESWKILVVDDEPETANSLAILLRRVGHIAHAITVSAQVLPWLHRSPCSVVILDLGMPDIDGISLIRMIRAEHPTLPVIIYTGYGYDEAMMEEALQAGANGYVSKNVPVEEIYAAIQRTMARRRHV